MSVQKKQTILTIKPYLKDILNSHPDLVNYIDVLPNGSNIIFRQSRIPNKHREQYAGLYRQATLTGRQRVQNPSTPFSFTDPFISQTFGTRQFGSISSTSSANYLNIAESAKLARVKQQIIKEIKKGIRWYSRIEVQKLLDQYPLSTLLSLLLDYQRNFPNQLNKVDFLAVQILIYGYNKNDLSFQNVINLIPRLPLSFIQKSKLYLQLVVGEYQKNRRSFVQAIELLVDYQAYMMPFDRSEAWFRIIQSALLREEVTCPQIRTYINRRNMVVPAHRAQLQQWID